MRIYKSFMVYLIPSFITAFVVVARKMNDLSQFLDSAGDWITAACVGVVAVCFLTCIFITPWYILIRSIEKILQKTKLFRDMEEL